MKWILLTLISAALLLTACTVIRPGCQVPCKQDDKVLKYTFGSYYNQAGKLTFKMYVTDTAYTAEAKRYFDLFRNSVMQNRLQK